MIKFLKYFGLFLLFLLVALVINLPIQHLLPYADLPKTVQIYGVDGRLLQGRAAEVVVNRFALRKIEYQFLPSCLLQLKVCYQIDYQQGRVQLGYDILNGDTELNRSQIDYPVAELLTQLPMVLPVKPSGHVQLVIDELSLVENQLVSVRGKLIWRDLGVDEQDVQINIGDYQVEFTGSDTQYDFIISDIDALLDVSGDGSISDDGSYEIDMRVSSEGSIDPQVKSVLELFAERTSVNKYRVEQQGDLPAGMTRQLFP